VESEIVTGRGRVLHRARPDDVAGIVALETQPAMSRYIGHWSAEHHLRNLTDSGSHYLVTRSPQGTVDGFSIVTQYAPKFRWYEFTRIAVSEPGEGRGSDVLVAVIGYVFDRLGAHRLQLEVYEDNLRARRAYARAGFREEGLLRDAVTRDGIWLPLVLMALLENERPGGSVAGVETRARRNV